MQTNEIPENQKLQNQSVEKLEVEGNSENQ
jgi:hypothetical protein